MYIELARDCCGWTRGEHGSLISNHVGTTYRGIVCQDPVLTALGLGMRLMFLCQAPLKRLIERLGITLVSLLHHDAKPMYIKCGAKGNE